MTPPAMNDRIQLALRTAGLTASETARRVGVSPEAVLQWLNGRTKNLRMAYLFSLARVTGFEAEWIATGNGPMRRPGADPAKAALVTLYDRLDDRGRATVLTVAEKEAKYGEE